MITVCVPLHPNPIVKCGTLLNYSAMKKTTVIISVYCLHFTNIFRKQKKRYRKFTTLQNGILGISFYDNAFFLFLR